MHRFTLEFTGMLLFVVVLHLNTLKNDVVLAILSIAMVVLTVVWIFFHVCFPNTLSCYHFWARSINTQWRAIYMTIFLNYNLEGPQRYVVCNPWDAWYFLLGSWDVVTLFFTPTPYSFYYLLYPCPSPLQPTTSTGELIVMRIFKFVTFPLHVLTNIFLFSFSALYVSPPPILAKPVVLFRWLDIDHLGDFVCLIRYFFYV